MSRSRSSLHETKALLARVVAFMEDGGSITDAERKHLFEDVEEEMRALERALEPQEPSWFCPNCGNTEGLQYLEWILANVEGVIVGGFETDNENHFWCPNCEGHYAQEFLTEESRPLMEAAAESWRKKQRTALDSFENACGGEE